LTKVAGCARIAAMKHLTHIFFPIAILFSLMSGCTSTPVSNAVEYEHLITRDIVKIISWMDRSHILDETPRLIEFSYQFQKAFPKDDVIQATVKITDLFLAAGQHAVGIHEKIISYVELHTEHTAETKIKHPEILYSKIEDILLEIEQWDNIMETAPEQVEELELLMTKYDFKYP
jgi:hypothetical protein